MLVSALARALSERVKLISLTIGRRGLLSYLKAVGGGNIVKIVPATESAGDAQTNGHKGLKVICGSNTSYLEDLAWIGDKTPVSKCDVRVSPKNSIIPNVGTGEFAEALSRVLPFTLSDDKRPVLQCVYIKAEKGKLTLVSADGYRLAMVSLDYNDGAGEVLIKRGDLVGVANALRKAKRVRVSFDNKTHVKALDIETELIRYKFSCADGTYPEYHKLIPAEFSVSAQFDTVEAIKAVSSLKALADAKEFPIDLIISDGMVVMANPDDKGTAELPADTEGEGKVRVDGGYLASVLKACGGMVNLQLAQASEPMLFSTDGYQVLVAPMMVGGEKEPEAEAEAEALKTEPADEQKTEPADEQKTEPADEQKTEPADTTPPKPKGKGKGKKKADVKNEAEKTPEKEGEKPDKVPAGVA